LQRILILIVMKYNNLIGRQQEIAQIEQILGSKKSEFCAIYGRRRVGKSFLVDEVCGKKIVFSAVGTYIKREEIMEGESYKKIQLQHFYDALCMAGLDATKHACPTCWREAFLELRILLSGIRTRRKVVVIDELPWLAGIQAAEMIEEIGYFWNSWADKQHNIVLFVLGSATSWMLDNVIHEYGGLHARLTATIHLHPFNLKECELYYRRKGFQLSKYEIAVAYMALGGIPYYLDKLDNKYSITDNIDHIFFNNDKIHQEFRDVYTGLYASENKYIDIVNAIASQFYGINQDAICKITGISSGGTLSSMLENLVESDIIRTYQKYGGERVETIYQVKDFFTLFYVHFIVGKTKRPNYWKQIQYTSEFYKWAGDSFELLCAEHIQNIKNALHINTIDQCYTWYGKDNEGIGAQIDMIIHSKSERTDFLCEMKFSESKYTISALEEEKIKHRISTFINSPMHQPSHSLSVVMATSFGLSASSAKKEFVNAQVTLSNLFS